MARGIKTKTKKLWKLYDEYYVENVKNLDDLEKLEKYIEVASELLDLAYPTMSMASAKLYQKLEKTIKPLEEYSSKELIKLSKELEKIIKSDLVSEVSEYRYDVYGDKAYRTFKKRYIGKGKKFTRGDFQKVRNVFSKLSEDLVDEFGSEQVQNFVQENADLDAEKLGDIIMEAYEETPQKGITLDKFRKNMTMNVAKKIKAYRKTNKK